MANNTNYTADSIEHLEYPFCVQRRPSMYIGGTNNAGAEHCFYEILDNSVDEAGIGHCDEIHVQLNADGSMILTDNGRGVPVDIHPTTGQSALEMVFCTLHAGGKFNEKAYAGVSGGLNGVGASCVNALSSKFRVVVKRDGKFWGLRCEDGHIKAKAQVIPNDKVVFPNSFKSGTQVSFNLNREIFTQFVKFDADNIRRRIKQAAFLNPGLKIVLIDDTGNKEAFLYPEGIKQYVQELNKNKKSLHEVFFCSEKVEEFSISVAFQYNDGYNEELISFANNIRTPGGGTHVSAFKKVMTKTFNTYAKTNNLLKQKDPELTGDDYREGLTAVINVKLPNIEFEGQTKSALNNESIKRPVENIFSRYLGFFLDANPNIAKIIIDKALQAARTREAMRKTREDMRKKSSALDGNMVDKLCACSSKVPEECELFIVEGDSAGGSAKQGRNNKTQAVLPLRGKVLNTYNIPRSKLYKNNEIANLLKALNIDLDEAEEENIKKLRYHKIVLMSDADPDGQHIECLLLTFLYCHARWLIEKGFVYVAEPPLFKVEHKGKKYYLKDDQALNDFKAEHNLTTVPNLSRFKGLGEMMPDQLEETAMNPETRSIKQISLDDIEHASNLLEIFLGSDTTQRKGIILGEDMNDTDEDESSSEEESEDFELETA
jgi:DNA gyrase subunit B